MKRPVLTLALFGLFGGAALVNSAEANHGRKMTYHYNGSQGYYTSPPTPAACVQPTAPAVYAQPTAYPQPYATQPVYASPQPATYAQPQAARAGWQSAPLQEPFRQTTVWSGR